MHKSIKVFSMDGEIRDDSDFLRFREQQEHRITLEMREQGYVPVLGLGPFWSTEYDEAKDKYLFKLSLHGYRVGRRLACQIEGITPDGKKIPRSTPPSKSSPSSSPAT